MSNFARAGLRHLRAHAVAYLALFTALSGSAYAASALPKASVGSRQLRTAAVNSAKVKDGSLRAVDFGAGQLPRGERGATGATGERGPAGPQGERGPSGYSIFDGPPPAGTTLSGFFDMQMPLATGKKAASAVSFPVTLAASQPAIVAFAPSVGAAPSETDAKCTGSAEEPTAPAGEVCIYSRGESGSGGFEWMEVSNRGFAISMTASGGNPDFVSFRATWAYTAP